MITDLTADRVALKYGRRAAVRATGLSLSQLEILASYGELSAKQWRIWLFDGVRQIGYALGEYEPYDEEDEDCDYA